MNPLVHTLVKRESRGNLTLTTEIRFSFIDHDLSVRRIKHTLNDSFEFIAERGDWLNYLKIYGREMIEKAERDIEHMKEIAQRQDEWLRGELAFVGVAP